MAGWLRISMAAALLAATTSCAFVLRADDGDEIVGEAPAPTPSPAPLSPSPDVPKDEREDPGTAWPLKITEQTRLALADSAREAGARSGAVEVETRGTIYYGVVFGGKPKDDDYYVIASTDSTYYWHRTGTGPWRYKGDGDEGRCAMPVPAALKLAWTGVRTDDTRSISPCPD
ncbi:hypothetical protein GCM10010439_09770 [Actinocorallia aurantiaca]|uniref:Lipoprotein n=2 Tax=Actinocorallia aurantiaca TaxID=46204 RepID=A0ABN3TY66_9ACTN